MYLEVSVMTQLTDIFNQQLFDQLPESIRDFTAETIKDPLAFFKEYGTHPQLDYALILNTISGRDRYNQNINSYRRAINCFNEAYTAQNSMFCSSLANVLPTIQSSSTSRYL